jgi:hypothetical protein
MLWPVFPSHLPAAFAVPANGQFGMPGAISRVALGPIGSI